MNNEITYRIIIDTTINDEKCLYNLLLPKDQPELSIKQVTAILSGTLAMSIRGSEDEAQTMRDVINYLNHEFVNTDSFRDVEMKIKNIE
jgi:hypothetical protein